MPHFVMIRHKVRDFGAWKVGYDAHRPRRIEAGLSDRKLLRSSGDGNEVVLLFEANDLDRARAFVACDDLREAMRSFGVADKPDIYFLNDEPLADRADESAPQTG